MATELTTRDRNQGLAEIGKRLDAAQTRLAEAMPHHINFKRLKTSFLMAMRDNPELMECSVPSLFGCMKEAASMGLEIGGPLSKAYMVPFRDSRKSTREAQLIIGYKGMIELMRRSGEVDQIDFECVHEGDKFKNLKGDDAGIYHEPSDDPDREKRAITHCYVIVRMRNGAKQRLVWPAAKINDHKQRFAQGWKRSDSPWQTHWETMAFKTMVRHMFNRGLIPVSAEIQQFIDRDVDRLESMATAVEVPGDSIVSDVDDLPDFGDTQEEPPPEQPPTDDDRLSDIEEATIITREQIDHAESAAEVAKIIKEMPSKLPMDVREELAVFASKKQEKLLNKQRKAL